MAQERLSIVGRRYCRRGLLKKEMTPAVVGGERFTCPHCLVWNYTKKIGGGGFKLNQTQITRVELVHDVVK